MKRVLLFLSLIVFFSYSTIFAQGIIFEDDFEDGNADEWTLESGWQVEDESGNFILSGEGHSSAIVGDTFWHNYSFKTKVKLMDNNSGVHLNYRNNGCERYLVGFTSDRLYLTKQAPCDTFTDLESINDPHDTNMWYTVKIVGDEGNIKVYLDDELKIDYTDSEPLNSGRISLEALPDSHIHSDDIVVTIDEPLSLITWVNTGGPLGGLGYDVRINPIDKNIMYVTDNFSGVAKSDNAGQTWYQSNSGISIKGGPTGDFINIFSLTIDPNNPDIVWAGTNGEGSAFGVFKSIDGGASWTLKTNGITLGSDIGIVFRGFTVQKGNSNVVYAQAEISTSEQGREFNRVKGRVYKTEDGGDSWRLIWEGDNLARYIIIDHDNLNVLYLSTGIFDREAYNSDCANSIAGGVGVVKSTDGGETWTSINNGLTDLYVGSLRMHPTNPQILFAGAGNNACSGMNTLNFVSGLFRTIDGGASWTKVITPDIITTVNFSSSSPDIIYAGSGRAFYRSEDGGLTWSKFSKPSVPEWGSPGVRAGVPIDVVIDPDNPTLLYANNYGGGVFRSVDGAETWEVWSKGYSGAEIHDVRIPDNTPSTVYAIGRSGPFVSSNYGGDWVGIANGDASFAEWYSVTPQPTNSKVVLIADEHQGVILRSTDGGSDFIKVFRHPGANAANPNRRQGFKTMVFSPSDPNVVYAGLAKDRGTFLSSSSIGTVIYKSMDAGATFSEMPSIIDSHNVNELVVDPDDSNIVYAATTNGVYKSANGATSWTHFDSLGNRQIEALTIDPQKPDYIIAGEIFGGIWISQDGGTSWTGPENRGFSSANPYISSLAVDTKDADVVYAGDQYSGIYRSSDKGFNWAPFPDLKMSGLSVRAVKDVTINGQVIYVATQGGGVFRYRRSNLIPTPISGDFGSVNISSSPRPQTFTISNNGTVNIEIGTLFLTGTDATEFSIQNDNCSNQTLAQSDICTVDVVFSPISAGAKAANLSIPSNDTETPTLDIPLSGTGEAVVPLPTITPETSPISTTTPDIEPTPAFTPLSTPTPEEEDDGKSFTFKCRQHSLIPGKIGFEKMILELGENEECTVTLTDLEPGVSVEFSTLIRKGLKSAIRISPENGVTDANGQMEFTISAIEKGSDWIAWAVRNDKGEFEFSKKAYDTGTAWGMFVEVK